MVRRPGTIIVAACATAAVSFPATPAFATPATQTAQTQNAGTAYRLAPPPATTAQLGTPALATTTNVAITTNGWNFRDWPSFWDLFPGFWDWWWDFIGDRPDKPTDPKPTPSPSPTTDKPTPTPSPTTVKPSPTATPTSTPSPVKPTPTATPTPTASPTQPGGSNRDQQQVLELVNQERTKRGLKPLTMDTCLRDRAAQEWSENMARQRRMYHQPMSQITRKCPGNRYVGENVAMGYTSPEAVMRGWMNSSGHRSNILRSGYTKIGVGVAKGSDGRLYWTQVFSR